MSAPTLPTDPHAKYTEHLFKGVCICACDVCTRRAQIAKGDRLYGVLCICPCCPEDICGCKTKPAVG